MPKAGLEPAQISPYAPETHVSTIPPLRHKYYTTTNYIQFSIELCTQCWKFPQGKPSHKMILNHFVRQSTTSA